MSSATWRPEIRAAWQLPDDITTTEWADKHRVLDPIYSAESGQWRTTRTPYLRGIMDAFADPSVEEITIKASTQVGKTESLLNMMGYSVDQDPAPVLYVMPNKEDAKSFSKNRIQPMLRLSDTLAGHITKRADDFATIEIRLDRTVVNLAGSNSPAGLASRPIRYLFLDETDKFPKFAGREADPIKLAGERTRTFWNRKIVKCSSPTTENGYIFREYERSDRRQYWVPCPHCGVYQTLVMAQLKWPEDERDPERVDRDRLAWYECAHCEKRIDDRHKPRMLLRGVWCPEGCEVTATGELTGDVPEHRHRGFWLNCFYSPWLTWSAIAAEWLDSHYDPELLMNFINSWLAEPWIERAEETTEDQLKMLRLDTPNGICPTGTLVLTAGVDVQKGHFYFVVRGWGYEEESWLVRSERVELWAEVITALFQTEYETAAGETLRVRLACIDSNYRTDEVYRVCRKWKDVARPIRGRDTLPGAPYQVVKLDKHPKTGKPMPGLLLWHLDTNHFKDKLARLIHPESDAPERWHLHEDPSEEYLAQMSAEHKVIVRDRKRGRTHEEWQPKTYGAPNHYWDCEVYATAAADMLRVGLLRQPGEAGTYRPPRRRRSQPWLDVQRGSWRR